MSDHNSSAKVQVTNNFSSAADVTIHHTYDTSPTESHTFVNVAPGATSAAEMVVTFNLGIFSPGHDNWSADVKVKAGPEAGQYISAAGPATMHSDDNGATLTMKVGTGGFNVDVAKNHEFLAWTAHP